MSLLSILGDYRNIDVRIMMSKYIYYNDNKYWLITGIYIYEYDHRYMTINFIKYIHGWHSKDKIVIQYNLYNYNMILFPMYICMKYVSSIIRLDHGFLAILILNI